MLLVEALNPGQLKLAYLAATGFTKFELQASGKCWQAEKIVGKHGISMVVLVLEDGSFVEPFSCPTFLSAECILKEMQAENICLQWDHDSNFEVFYRALPEICASDRTLEKAFMKVVIKKEIGDFLDEKTIDLLNINKTKIIKGA